MLVMRNGGRGVGEIEGEEGTKRAGPETAV